MNKPNPQKILDLANAFYQSQTLFCAADFGVFTKIAKANGITVYDLADELKISRRGCRLLLNACVACGLLTKEDELYYNTPTAEMFLVADKPTDMTSALRYNRDVYAAWGKVSEFVRSGQPVERPEIHLGEDAKRTRDFALSMHGRAMAIGQVAVPQLQIHSCKNLLDVGGGAGTYAMLIAQKNPQIICHTLDLPAISAIAAELIAEQNLSARVKTIAGDYHTHEFPQEMDAVIFFGVLHQENPPAIMDLFARAFKCLRPGGKIYVMDMMTDRSGTLPQFSALFSLNMALTTEHGWVFSDVELYDWLQQSGFIDYTVIPLPPPMPHWLAVAHKP